MDKIQKIVLGILDKGYLMSLATVDDGGVWVADVIYIHNKDLNIYWMSDPDVRHSLAILKNNKVAGAITISGPGEDNEGIQFEGTAEKIEEPRFDLAVKHFKKRNKPSPREDEDVLQGDSWYVLRLDKIELIYEKLFGFEKQKLIL